MEQEMTKSTIDLTEFGYKVGEKQVAFARVTQMTFKQLAAILTEARARGKDARGIRKIITNLQMKNYVALVDTDDKEHKITDEMMLVLPAKVGKAIYNGMTFDSTKQGTIVKEGDGITDSVIYKLGTPLETGTDSIKELEFHAKLYSSIEDVLAEDSQHEQTLALLEHTASPIGTTLLALPSWAVDQLTVADGMFIMQKILPGFLE